MNNKLSQELCHVYNAKEEHLQHHGIKNMHWGVKNGPPYPLDKKVSARIKKGKNEKARFTKKELEYMRKHPNSKKYRDKKVGISHVSDKLERFISDVNIFYKDPQAKGTPYYDAKTWGAASTNVADLISQTNGSAYRTLDRPGHKVNLIDVKKCNSQRYYDKSADPGVFNNCGKCAATMFLRGLGYDVQAGRVTNGVLNTAHQYWFDGAKAYKQKGAANVYQQMASFGNQGKGVLAIRHATGGGHAVYFQNERGADGRIRPVIYDGQIGKRYDTVAQFLKAEHADMTQFSTVTRLDTSTPNWKHLAEDSVCRRYTTWREGFEKGIDLSDKETDFMRITDPKWLAYRNVPLDNLYNTHERSYSGSWASPYDMVVGTRKTLAEQNK